MLSKRLLSWAKILSLAPPEPVMELTPGRKGLIPPFQLGSSIIISESLSAILWPIEDIINMCLIPIGGGMGGPAMEGTP